MTKRITVPSTIEDATTQLEGLGSLLTAKEWEKSAIVFAFTYEGKPGPKIAREVVRSTIRDFAKLGITGLKTQDSVRFYRNCWKRAILEHNAAEAQPGEKVALPDADFPPIPRGTDGYDSKEGAQKTIERIVEKHGATVIPPTTVVDAVEQNDDAQRELTRRSAVRNARHREHIEQESQGLRDIAAQAKANYDRSDTGQDNETAQTLVRLIRLVHEAELVWAMKGGERNADIVSQLSELQSAVDDWRQRITGSGSVEISEDDRAWADELGIDLGIAQS